MALFIILDLRTRTARSALLSNPAFQASSLAMSAKKFEENGWPLTAARLNEAARWLSAKVGANVLPFPAYR